MNGPDNKKDLYKVLGVPRDASQEDIKRAYRKLVRKYHPDANPGDKEAEQRFKSINEAYEVLGDPQKRQQYDQFGTIGDTGGEGPFSGGFDPFGDIFGDIFDSMFGGFGGTRQRGPTKGDDLEMTLSVSLEEAYFGSTRKVTIPRWETCETCHGTGAEPGTEAKTCSACGGTGQRKQQQRTPFGTFVNVTTCPDCKGTGKKIDSPCRDCGGAGKVRKRREVEVKIPEGVDTGVRLRVSGEGGAGSLGGPPGDLYLLIKVEDDPRFQREGDDLHVRKHISFPEAALGSEIEVELIEGTEKIEIPQGTQSGHVIKIKAKGMPRLGRGGNGNAYVHIVVDVPKKLSDKERGLIEALAREMDVSVKSGGFMEKLRQWLD
ncbi:MAG: molecular chaperone DnaJ [Thermovirgaceae bacterium]